MQRTDVSPAPAVHYPEVIWESSIPECWRRIFEKKSRPATSKSARLFKRELPHSEALDRQHSTFDHLYTDTFTSHRPQTSPKAQENSFYTIKYLGITNGEIGILSQRKPLTSPKAAFRYAGRPSTQQSSRSAGVSRCVRDPASKAPFDDTFPAEFVRPTPEKYNEYLVHQYSRPHPLSTVRRTPDSHFAGAATMLATDTSKYSKTFALEKPAKIERKGVSGWKLTRPRSQDCIAKPRVPSLPPKEKRATVIVQSSKTTAFRPAPSCEAYIEYLLLKKKLKSPS